jgi:hypothetical protein
VLTGPIALTLLARVPNTVDAPLAGEAREGWTPLPVEFDNLRRDRQLTLPLHVEAPARLLRHSKVAILLATFETAVILDEASIEWRDGSCAYTAAGGAILENNQTLEFTKAAGCRATDRPADLAITIRLRKRGRVAVWTYVPPAATQAPELVRIFSGNPGTFPAGIVRGRFVEMDDPAVRRIALLNYVWNVADGAAWIWMSVLCAGILFAAGCLALPERSAPGIACVALALATLYVTLTPPLQAPDEPAHLLGLAKLTSRPALAAGTEALARRGHLQRIRFHGDERFGPRDAGHPWPEAWSAEVYGHDVASRSVIASSLWRAAMSVLPPTSMPRTLLMIRLVNALVFALAMGGAAAAMRRWAPGGAADLLPLVLLMVPALPFFAMQVSEFSLLADVYILLAASLSVLVADRPEAHRTGILFGAATAVALLGGRSAAPLLPLVAAAAAGRALLGSSTPRGNGLGEARIFWGGCAAGLALFPAFATGVYTGGVWPADAHPAAGWFRSIAESIRFHPALVLAIPAFGLAIEALMIRVKGARVGIPTRLALTRLGGYALAGMVVLSLAGSLVHAYPTLATRETAPPATPMAYTGQVVAVGLTALRLTNTDLLLGSSFWGGFGWIDTVLPSPVVAGLIALTSLALIVSGLTVARRHSSRQALWLVLVATGAVASLAAYAWSAYYVNRNLHGRYVMGLYLSMLPLAWAIPLTRVGPHQALRLRYLLLAVVAAVHAYALPFILRRYF